MRLCPVLHRPTIRLGTEARSFLACQGSYPAGRREVRLEQRRSSSQGDPPACIRSQDTRNCARRESYPWEASLVTADCSKAGICIGRTRPPLMTECYVKDLCLGLTLVRILGARAEIRRAARRVFFGVLRGCGRRGGVGGCR